MNMESMMNWELTEIHVHLQRHPLADVPAAPGPGGAAEPTSRRKRVVLIGDHRQLPPVVKNMAFQRYRPTIVSERAQPQRTPASKVTGFLL